MYVCNVYVCIYTDSYFLPLCMCSHAQQPVKMIYSSVTLGTNVRTSAINTCCTSWLVKVARAVGEYFHTERDHWENSPSFMKFSC